MAEVVRSRPASLDIQMEYTNLHLNVKCRRRGRHPAAGAPMRIGQLARTAGVSTDTVRYYEKLGLLPAPQRTESGYREYPSAAGHRIRVIRNAVQLGFPLAEVAKFLTVRDSGGAPCRQVRDYARQMVGEIDQRIAQLSSERRDLAAMIRGWDRKLQQARGGRAHLLEGPNLPVRTAEARHTRLRRRR